MKKIIYSLLFSFPIMLASVQCQEEVNAKKLNFKGVEYFMFKVDLNKQELKFHWKNETGEIHKNFKSIKAALEEQGNVLQFAINGGIYDRGNIPKGLYIENGKTFSKLDQQEGKGNFYLKPNGVFLIDYDNQAAILPTENVLDFDESQIKNALQSGPLLLQQTQIHPKFNPHSTSKYIRAGVGQIGKKDLVFILSDAPVNLYDFALLFKEELQCDAALYLDGAICKMYLPQLGKTALNGNFASMISLSTD